MKRLWVVGFLLLILSQSAFAAKAKKKAEEDEGESKVGPGCKAELLMDYRTGEILFDQNSHEKLRPASMVKLMLAYVVLKKIEEGEIKGGDIVTVSAKAAKIGGSQVYLKQGEQFPVNELLEAVLVQSANDACVALAEHISGTTEAFVDLMNEAAEDLGMKESEFHYPHGLPPNKGEQPDLVSANDFAILARILIQKYPEILDFTGKMEVPFRNGTFIMRNHNKLLVHYPGADGLKTGFYDLAGFSVTATAQKNGERMIAVIMGCNNRKVRDAEAAKLLSKGFAQFKSVRLLKKGETLQGRIKVERGDRADAQAIASEEVRATLRANEQDKVVQVPNLCSSLKAPVALGAKCGKVSFKVGDREVASVDAVAGEEVPEASGLKKWMSYFGR